MRFFPRFMVLGFSNTYLVADEEGREGVLIDPGRFDANLLQLIESNRLTIGKILVTHAHESHIHGITTLLKIYDAQIFAFRDRIMDLKTTVVKNGDVIRSGALEFQVIETPGHTRDSLAFHVRHQLFTGDTLTAGLTGTAVHDKAHDLLLSSIRRKILSLPEETLIFPGHGPPTRVGIEKRHNVILNEVYPRARSSSSFF